MKNWSKLLLYSIIVVSILVAIFLIFNFYSTPNEPYSVNVIFMKLNILQGGEIEKAIQITNNENQEKEIKIRLEGLEGMAVLDVESVSLSSFEKKDIVVVFKANGNSPGIYFGNLIIECSSGVKRIPIILGVEEPDRIFAIAQSGIPAYENVYPGSKFGVDIKTFDLLGNDLREIKIEYQIKNSEDKVVFSEQENSAIKGTFEITKVIDIPEDFAKGDYVFITSIISENHKSYSGYLFKVASKEEATSSGEWSFGSYFFWFVLGFIFVILALFFYFVKSGDDIIAQLQKQHTHEIKYYSGKIENQKRESILKVKSEKDKKSLIEKFEEAKKKIIGDIKNEQKKQIGEACKIKKIRNRKDINKKLVAWRKKVYMKASKAAQESSKLNLKMGTLQKAYSQGFISRESFNKGKLRIQSATSKLKRKSL